MRQAIGTAGRPGLGAGAHLRRGGVATGNFLNNPERFRSKNHKWEFNVDKANEVLEAAGWKKGADGIRAKDGKKLKFVFQTSTNTPRQKTQAIVKQACQKAGIELELKSVTSSVFFSSDVANPDTYTKFYCDIQMYNTGMAQPDPTTLMAAVPDRGTLHQGKQVAGSQRHPLDQPRIRQALQGRGRRTRSGQTRGDVHPHERSRMRRSCRDSAGLSPAHAAVSTR